MSRAQIIALCGARDGVGKTTFALNAALSFRRETRKNIIIMDLDRESCGDIQALLGLDKARSVAEFAPYLQQLDPQKMGQYLSVHQASGVAVVPLVSQPDQKAQVTVDAVAGTIDRLGMIADYIFIDCGVGVHDEVLAVLERAAGIFLLTTPDLRVAEHTRRMISSLQHMHFPRELMQIVLNRYDKSSGLTPDQWGQRLGKPPLCTLPDESAVANQAAMQAKPFVLAQSRANLTRTYAQFARQVVEKKVLEQLSQIGRPQGVRGVEGRASVTPMKPELVEELKSYQKKRGSNAADAKEIDPRTATKILIHKRMIEVIDLKKMSSAEGNRAEQLQEQVKKAVLQIFDDVGAHITDRAERQRIVQEILDEALGLGPLESFLADEAVTEIMVNRRDRIFVERNGKLTLTDASFTDDAQLLGVIERIVAPIGRRIDERSPMVDARLVDGSRVNAIIPPLAIDGPCITIRKFATEPLEVKDLIQFGSFSPEIADFLRACVEARLNILISGGTGSGKTTLLNVMSSFIPSGDRIVTVEDSAELQLNQPHVVRLETRPPNIEGAGEISIRDLVKNTLRMRPDRIVVGECRGAEAVDMLQAMNTGHDGSLTTIHSNSPRDCISRLETLVMFAGLDLPSKAIREQISSAVNIIVQQARLSDGSRKVTQISEVTGMEGAVITLQDIFVYRAEGVDENYKVLGKFQATGFVPKFVHTLKQRGIKLPEGIFAAAPVPQPRGRRR